VCPSAGKPFVSLADLEALSEEKSKQEIHTLNDYALFHQEFRRLATCLAKEKKIPEFCLNKAYENSIHPILHKKVCSTYTMGRPPMKEVKYLC